MSFLATSSFLLSGSLRVQHMYTMNCEFSPTLRGIVSNKGERGILDLKLNLTLNLIYTADL